MSVGQATATHDLLGPGSKNGQARDTAEVSLFLHHWRAIDTILRDVPLTTMEKPAKGLSMRFRSPLLLVALFLAPAALTSSGCASHRVAPMAYTADNPYAPHGVLYESWEQKQTIDGLLRDSRVTHTAIGAGGGALVGQAIGRDTEGTLWGTGIGAAAGLTHGSISHHNQRIAYEDRMTRLANDWQTGRNQEIQDKKDVALGATVTQEQLQERLARLESARAALKERDKNVDMARQMREIDAEISRLNATTTTRLPR